MAFTEKEQERLLEVCEKMARQGSAIELQTLEQEAHELRRHIASGEASIAETRKRLAEVEVKLAARATKDAAP